MDKPKEKAIKWLKHAPDEKGVEFYVKGAIDIAFKEQMKEVFEVIDKWGIKQHIEETEGFKELKQKLEELK